jgi:predicted lipid-binding transport protein (Tim44 family)
MTRADVIFMWKAAVEADPHFDETLEDFLEQWEIDEERKFDRANQAAVRKVQAAWGVQDSDIAPAWLDPSYAGESWDG